MNPSPHDLHGSSRSLRLRYQHEQQLLGNLAHHGLVLFPTCVLVQAVFGFTVCEIGGKHRGQEDHERNEHAPHRDRIIEGVVLSSPVVIVELVDYLTPSFVAIIRRHTLSGSTTKPWTLNPAFLASAFMDRSVNPH